MRTWSAWFSHTKRKNPVEFRPYPYELHDTECGGHLMGQTAQHYVIFRNRRRLLRHRLEQSGYHALPVADEKRCAGCLEPNPTPLRRR